MITEEVKQGKILELANLISQYNSGERESINADEFNNWELISSMLKKANINEDIYEDFLVNPTHYVIEDQAIIFNKNWKDDELKAKEKAFNKAFFNTSLGYIRREVAMLDGTTKTFLTDMLPQLIIGFPILAYEKPDFTQNVEMVDYQKQVLVTEEFLQECKNQLIIDFYGFSPMA